MDGVVLTSGTDYDAKAGSVVITLEAPTLQKLEAGNHTVTVNLDDGSVSTVLNVKAAGTAVAAGSRTTTAVATGDSTKGGLGSPLRFSPWREPPPLGGGGERPGRKGAGDSLVRATPHDPKHRCGARLQ